MFDHQQFKNKVGQFLKQPEAQIKDDAILTDLVAESFMLVEMVIELQEEFGIRLVQDDLKHVKTVGQLVEVFKTHSAK